VVNAAVEPETKSVTSPRSIFPFDLFSDSGGDVDDVAETEVFSESFWCELNHAISQTSASEEVGNKDGQV
jgi:hypothetical protein